MYAISWLVIMVVMLVMEIVTLGLTTIWFGGGALIAFLAALLGAPLWLQIALFVIVSLILLFATRPIAVKYFNKSRVKTNVDSMIGKTAIVMSEIDNLQGIGQVQVSGQEWTARSTDDEVKLEPGQIVTVVEVIGVKLIVEKQMHEETLTKKEEIKCQHL